MNGFKSLRPEVRGGRVWLHVAILAVFVLPLLLPASPAHAQECVVKHKVKRGETLWAIGRFYGVDWGEIARANSLANPNLIFPGQEFCIPGITEVPPSGTTGEPSTPAQPAPPASSPTTPAAVVIPTISVQSVVRDNTVEIRTLNYPAGVTFRVRMGLMGTQGINGVLVKTIDSGAGGSLTQSFEIPESLRGQQRISIRLESDLGYYSFNWFYNTTTP